MSNSMFNALQPVLVVGVILTVLYLIIKAITEYILKKKMIEKGYIDQESQSIFKQEKRLANKFASLKWGLVIFFGGLALVLLEYIPYDYESTLPFGLVALFTACGFLIYYFMVRNEINNNE